MEVGTGSSEIPSLNKNTKERGGISKPSSSGILLSARWYLLNLLVLAGFKSIWHKLESFGKRESQLRKFPPAQAWPMGKIVVHFSDCCGRAQPTMVLWPLCWWSWVLKKAVWVRHGYQASKQSSFMVFTSVAVSRFQPRVPALTHSAMHCYLEVEMK